MSVDKLYDKAERRLVVIKDGILPCVIDCVIILECVAILVHKEYAWYASHCKGVVVAVVCKLGSIKRLEVVLLGVYLLE